MMISPTGASDPYGAAAALDRRLRASNDDAGDSPSDGAVSDASPDVVVTFSKGASSPATYNASGKLSGAPTLDDMGANAPDSLAHATESTGDDADADTSDAASGSADAAAVTPDPVAEPA